MVGGGVCANVLLRPFYLVMFEAFIIVCSLIPSADPRCVELHDITGPHNTYVQCQERVEDMLPELPKMFMPPYTVGYKCEKSLGV